MSEWRFVSKLLVVRLWLTLANGALAGHHVAEGHGLAAGFFVTLTVVLSAQVILDREAENDE